MLLTRGLAETMGDMTKHGQRLMAQKAAGTVRQYTRFKSSVNQSASVKPWVHQAINAICNWQLMLLADVGMLGMPNAGKSTFIRATLVAKAVKVLLSVYYAGTEPRCCAYGQREELRRCGSPTIEGAGRGGRSWYSLPEAP